MKYFFSFILITFSFIAFCQSQKKEKFKLDTEKIFTGGNIGLNFGRITYIEASPIIGYSFIEKFS
jgi:hypothetical protein